jgi:hypothetical protein
MKPPLRSCVFRHPLPEAHSLGRREIKFLSWLNIKSRVPGINIVYGVGAVLRGCMRIRHHLLTERSFPDLGSPVLGKGDEELLVAGKTILWGAGLPASEA